MKNYNDLAENILQLFWRIHCLDLIPRAGFLLRGVPNPESVSAHSHFLATLTLIFVREEPERYDQAKALAMALVHDLAESQLMDIPMPVANAWLGDAKDKAEEGVFNELFKAFPDYYSALHDEFQQGESNEAQLLRALDKAQMMIKVLYYEKQNRGCLEEFWQKPGNFNDMDIPLVSALFDLICKKAGKKRPV
ncbi:MAG: HD domain-containing protein [Candidatus Hydrogenedentes bacterium]|nr:HD domain-containing protein [Candidatus Hydrogenedentota bacterium]